MKTLFGIMIISMLASFASEETIAQKNSLKGLPQGAIVTTTTGYAMSAKINGKDCKAFAMMPADKTGQIVGFYNGDKYIGLPYHKSDFVKGKKFDFSNENTDLTTNDEVQVWNGRKGEMEITKVTPSYAEGTFYFTGYSYDNKKTIEVTNGFFRILLK